MICKECGEEFLRIVSHVEKIHGSYLDYLLKFDHDGIWPLCLCGCGEKVEFRMTGKAGFREYIHGHHARGRAKSENEKRKIGEKNSVKMKEYMMNHPEEVVKRRDSMQAGQTDESRRKSKEKLVKYIRSEEGRSFASLHFRRLWDEGKMEKGKEKAGETLRRRFSSGELVRTQEQKDKISETITGLYRSGGFQWSKGNHYSPKTGKTSYYRSSWELRFMVQLDNDPHVKDYQYEPFVIPYVWDGGDHRYLPDFLVEYSDGRKELIEVGPEKLKEENFRNQAKIESARLFCESRGWTFRVVSF